MILIPFKNRETAKQRLSPMLQPEERHALAEAMLEDVFEAVGMWRGRPSVMVISGDPFACTLAQRYGLEVLNDERNGGETDAIEMATRVACDRNAEFTLVIPGDIPLVTASELQRIMDAAPARGSVLVPAWDDRGTNAALRRPGDLFPLRFGNDSFQPHLRAAHSTGLPCMTLQLPGIAIDVDNPGDLHRLIAVPGNTRAQRLARQWQVAERACCS